MRVLVVLMALSLVWGSCKKKENGCSVSDCLVGNYGDILIHILDENNNDYLTKNEAFKNNDTLLQYIKVDTLRRKNIVYFLKTESFAIQNYYLKMRQSDIDTITFKFGQNKIDYEVYYNSKLICPDCSNNKSKYQNPIIVYKRN